MHLRGIDFGHCWDMSGVRGFFGEGYAYHRLFKNHGLTFQGSTFVAKTTTLLPRLDPKKKQGNMRLKKDGITPARLLPDCIKVYPLRGFALNAVGLSGPGARNLLERKIWQKFTEPFCLSFMSVAPNAIERKAELVQFVNLLRFHLPSFSAPVALQINFTCPNVGIDHGSFNEMAEEIWESLTIASVLGISLIPKLNVEIPPILAKKISEHSHCDAICQSNTVAFGRIPDKINWHKLVGKTSPLAKYGGGGLSGAPLLPLVEEWVRLAREVGVTKPIIAGGGILHPRDAYRLARAGASCVAVGSMSMLRPWRMQTTINRANVIGARNEFYYPPPIYQGAS